MSRSYSPSKGNVFQFELLCKSMPASWRKYFGIRRISLPQLGIADTDECDDTEASALLAIDPASLSKLETLDVWVWIRIFRIYKRDHGIFYPSQIHINTSQTHSDGWYITEEDLTRIANIYPGVSYQCPSLIHDMWLFCIEQGKDDNDNDRVWVVLKWLGLPHNLQSVKVEWKCECDELAFNVSSNNLFVRYDRIDQVYLDCSLIEFKKKCQSQDDCFIKIEIKIKEIGHGDDYIERLYYHAPASIGDANVETQDQYLTRKTKELHKKLASIESAVVEIKNSNDNALQDQLNKQHESQLGAITNINDLCKHLEDKIDQIPLQSNDNVGQLPSSIVRISQNQQSWLEKTSNVVRGLQDMEQHFKKSNEEMKEWIDDNLGNVTSEIKRDVECISGNIINNGEIIKLAHRELSGDKSEMRNSMQSLLAQTEEKMKESIDRKLETAVNSLNNDIAKTLEDRFGTITTRINDQLKKAIHEAGNSNQSRDVEEILAQQITMLSDKMDTVCQNLAATNSQSAVNEHESIKQWLTETVKLPQYYNNFIDNGFITLDTVCDVTKKDLKQIGIKLIGHQKEILRHAKVYNDRNDPNSTIALPANTDQIEIHQQAIRNILNLFQPSDPKSAMKSFHIKGDEIRRYVQSKCVSNDITFEDEEDEKYKDHVTEYHEANDGKNTVSDPLIYVYKSKRRNAKQPVPQKQSEVIEVYDIVDHDRIPALNGQKGLRARTFIGDGTILGEYYTKQMLSYDLDTLRGTKVFNDTNRYGFNASVQIEMPIKDVQRFQSSENTKKRARDEKSSEIDGLEPPQKRQKCNNNLVVNRRNRNYNKYESQIIDHTFHIVLDGYSFKPRSKLLYMNDCRLNIEIETSTEQDEEYQNVKFMTVYIGNWPKILAVATRNIEEGEELLSYYGDYRGLIETDAAIKRKYERLKKELTPIGLSNLVSEIE